MLIILSQVLAHVLLRRIQGHLLKHQRPEQPGFTPSVNNKLLPGTLNNFGMLSWAALAAKLYNGSENTVKCRGGETRLCSHHHSLTLA